MGNTRDVVDRAPQNLNRNARAQRERSSRAVDRHYAFRATDDLRDIATFQEVETVADIAKTGVDVISVGALTHSAPSLDIGLDVV